MKYSVFKRATSTNYSVEFKDSEGTKRRLSLKTKNKKEAYAKAPLVIIRFNDDLQKGDNKKSQHTVKLSRLLEEVYKDRWADCKDSKNFKSRSLRLLQAFGDPLISEITSKDIVNLRGKLKEGSKARKGFDVSAALKLRNEGKGFGEIAALLGESKSTVYRGLKSVSKTSTENV